MIKASGVSVTYQTDAGTHPALEDVDLNVTEGRSCVVIGPTGCGKTSLLHLLSGLLRPTTGTVMIAGKPLQGTRRETSLILQQQGLFPWKKAYDNAVLGLTVRGTPRKERFTIARSLMEELGIWDVKDSYPAQLSGGQRQRVAIARSLATEPDLLLMDEPFSALDAMTRETLQNLLLRIWIEHKFTFVMVTHSIEEAVFLGSRVLVLSSRPGRIVHRLDNPDVGSDSYRLTEKFHRTCLEVRQALEGAM
ncbi:ABC transporter ATP-binding protein [bacterium]|nr:MAG: ABC transporter ATP-binding protein [bacterium]